MVLTIWEVQETHKCGQFIQQVVSSPFELPEEYEPALGVHWMKGMGV